mgnify:CR=1 FL=1
MREAVQNQAPSLFNRGKDPVVVTLISKSMAKSDFNNSVFVVKVYEHITPLIVEVFQQLNKVLVMRISIVKLWKELVKEDTMWLCLSHKPTVK